MTRPASTPVVDLLDRWGPGHCSSMGLEEARSYCRDLALCHGENFSVLNRFVPARMHEGMCAVYAFCRWADDLGDETGDRDRSAELLAWWRSELDHCFQGSPRHPVFIALAPVIERHGLISAPFEHLIGAFQSDQLVSRHDTWEQVLDYCRGSADPVGRLVLALADEPCTQEQLDASDAICTALQLTNHWQDVKRDLLQRDRIYLPRELHDIDSFDERLLSTVTVGHAPDPDFLDAYRALVRECADRTWTLFDQGRPLLSMVSPEIRPILWLFHAGGTSVLRRIELWNCETCLDRPRLGPLAKLLLVLRARRASRVEVAA